MKKTVRTIIELGLFDENEQVVIISGDIYYNTIEYKGKLENIPSNLYDEEIDCIGTMTERKRRNLNLNEYGWLEIWLNK